MNVKYFTLLAVHCDAPVLSGSPLFAADSVAACSFTTILQQIGALCPLLETDR